LWGKGYQLAWGPSFLMAPPLPQSRSRFDALNLIIAHAAMKKQAIPGVFIYLLTSSSCSGGRLFFADIYSLLRLSSKQVQLLSCTELRVST